MANSSAHRALPRQSVHRSRLRPNLALVVGLVAVIAIVSACISAEDAPAAPVENPVLVQGRTIYVNNCVTCHGSSGAGGVGSKLSDGRVIERYPDIAAQLTIVSDGVRAMPAFNSKLSAQELEAVVSYTREVLAKG